MEGYCTGQGREGEKGHLHKFDIWQLFAWLVKSRGGGESKEKGEEGRGWLSKISKDRACEEGVVGISFS